MKEHQILHVKFVFVQNKSVRKSQDFVVVVVLHGDSKT